MSRITVPHIVTSTGASVADDTSITHNTNTFAGGDLPRPSTARAFVLLARDAIPVLVARA